ncbi:ribosome maturation factor RimM [Psychromicrobium lacuslunae]|uniref:Ribosome maturation factor RimM n=1 Tax=Psychromicrobium lacuslunae TaxID=1618207 RepID=A0A0D4BY28_9MICC|nr:ribosome maturation factor RimM [Psychromicrobium lacuslunae]AJT41219.1 ribosome maturation factor RimM [Psychromicrobium lacuslunae]
MQVQVARIGKPHGIRGEVTVELFTDAPEERFVRGVIFNTQEHGELTVNQARWNKDTLLLGFAEVPDRNRAEELRGTKLFIETADVEDETEEGWYEHELVGLEVRLAGRKIGVVSALRVMPVQDLLVVTTDDGEEVLVPFVDEIVPEVDPEQGFVLVTPPDGLFELNRESQDGAAD